MVSRRNVASRAKTKKKRKAKSSKPIRSSRALKRAEAKHPATPPSLAKQPSLSEPSARVNYKLTIENIRGDTSIGDLIVSFPRTREVLVRNGLRLEADDAGDIYMNLDAFSAMNGLKIESLVQELVETAKEPGLQSPEVQLAPPQTA